MLEDNEQRRAYFYSDAYWPRPDSASTATAMSTGVKTYSASIAWPPDIDADEALDTSPALLRRFFDMSIGFVSTVPLSHATPAGFFAHNRNRNQYIEIAREILTQVRPEVVIGGNWDEDAVYYDQSDVDWVIAADDTVVVHLEPGVDGNDSIAAAAEHAFREKKRLLGIYDGGERPTFPSPVAVDRPGSPQIERESIESPLLANSSIAALEVLSRDPEGFFLLIEQGHIDWANHNNDFARMIGCVADLDAAVRAIIDFVDRPDDAVDWSNTTLIVTADHATGYLRFERTLGRGDLPNDGAVTDTALSSSNPDQEITYGTTSHTSELVSVYAKGFAAAKLHDYETAYRGLGIIDNTAIYRITLDAARR
jgi:alkaline phosphatase